MGDIEARSKCFVRKGTVEEKLTLQAHEVITALAGGQDVEIQYAFIEGDLNFKKIIDKPELGKSDSLLLRSIIYIRDSEFRGSINFQDATFEGSVDFSRSRFNKQNMFTGAVFYKDARFDRAQFITSTYINRVRFIKLDFGHFLKRIILKKVVLKLVLQKASFLSYPESL